VSQDFNKGDIVLYTDPPQGHFIPDRFMAVVAKIHDDTLEVDIGNDVRTEVIKEYCELISDQEHFKLILGGVYNVKPTEL
jgi:hypothetical protein